MKADKDSANLRRLQQASRGVTQATAAVVASTKSGKSQIEETGEGRFYGNLILFVSSAFLLIKQFVLLTYKVSYHLKVYNSF